MPNPLSALAAAIRGPRPQAGAAAITRADRILGGLVALVLVGALVAFAVIYLRPPGQQDLVFETTDASAITAGQNVRVAGITVGKVTSTKLLADRVVVRARIDDDVHIGDLSRIEVRLLTPVGGYAVTLIPHGATRAADGKIPKDRVRVPYSVADVLQVVPRVTDDVSGSTVRANLLEVGQALQGQPDAVRALAGGLESVARTLDDQRIQAHRVAALAREYMTQVNASREFVFTLLGKIDRVVTEYRITRAGFNRAFDLFGDVLLRLGPLQKFYLDRADRIGEHVQSLRDLVTDANTRIGPAIDDLMKLRGLLMAWARPSAATAGDRAWAGDVCIPVPGQEC